MAAVAHLEVISRDTGCQVDPGSVIDSSKCPDVAVKTESPAKKEDKIITVTPTEVSHFSGSLEPHPLFSLASTDPA